MRWLVQSRSAERASRARCAYLHTASPPDVPLQVMFICERLQFGNAVMDENSDFTFTTAVSRQLPVRSGQDANLVAAMQLKVRQLVALQPSGVCPHRLWWFFGAFDGMQLQVGPCGVHQAGHE